MLKRSSGFTLIELLVVISIIAVLSTIGIVTYSQTQILARDARRKSDLRALQTALELFRQKPINNVYPNTGCAGAAPYNCYSTTGGNWIPGLDTNYINSMPKDPTNDATYRYRYTTVAGGGSFQVCVRLENQSDKDLIAPATEFCVANP